MRAFESTFQSYKSKRILSFANLICSSVSGPKAPQKRVCVLSYSVKVKIYGTFSKSVYKKSLSWKNSLKEKIRKYDNCYFNLLTVKIWGQLDNFSFEFKLFQGPLQVKKIDSRKQRLTCQSDG